MTISQFRGDYRFLSNFWLADVQYEGLIYPSVEHAFAASKTLDREERTWVKEAKTPGDAKRRGQRVTLRQGWNEGLRIIVMRELIQVKFEYGTELASCLRHTAYVADWLVESNTWHDQIWGNCTCGAITCVTPGANLLGWLLVDRRTELLRGDL
jgi:ribA/ribD-fused uncharacterized protein